MRQFNLLLLALLVFVQISTAQSEGCQTLQKYVTEPIQQCCSDNKGNSWVISGSESNKLYHIKKIFKGFKAIDLTQKEKLQDSTKFTSILFIDKTIVLVGTNKDYIYHIKNRKLTHLTQPSGLSDSIILGVKKSNDQVIVTTSKSEYLYTGFTHRKKPCFQLIVPTQIDTVPIANFIKRNIQLPLQRWLCNLASPIDLSFRNKKYITHKDLKQIKEQLRPGDILIRRNDEQLSNVGIPGFWKHAAIYVGSAKELNEYFDSIPLPLGMTPDDLMKKQNQKVFKKLGGKRFQIIEVIGKGTMFNPVEHIAKSDYFAAFRPNLTKQQVFSALINALNCYGLPYDYLFEFSTPNALVCSELVYRAYQSNATCKAIDFQMGTYAGLPFLSPNDIAVQFANEYKNKPEQLQLLFFYDADEKGKVTCKTAEEFNQSIGR